MYSPKIPVLFDNVIFRGSIASAGSALFVDSTDVNITNALFEQTESTLNGGAMVFIGSEKSTIAFLHEVVVKGAKSGGDGGAFYSESSKVF